jgi:GNAT superfamily N-acetyltransferase
VAEDAPADPIEIAELEPEDPRLGDALGVMRELRVDRSVEELADLLREGRERGGYRLVGLFESGVCRAAAGYRVVTSFAHGRHLYVEDLVTARDRRKRGHGERLEAHLADVARAAGCVQIRLSSGVGRRRAHRFYFRRGYAIESFDFGRRLDGREDG